jgi:hypothetical protein
VWNKEGVAGSQKWLPYHHPGVFGGERRTKTGTEREQSNGGEFPKTLTPSSSIDITRTLELEHTTLSISRSTLSLRDPSCFKLNPVTHAFLSFFSQCTTLDRSNISFLFTNLIIYIEIWHSGHSNLSLVGGFACDHRSCSQVNGFKPALNLALCNSLTHWSTLISKACSNHVGCPPLIAFKSIKKTFITPPSRFEYSTSVLWSGMMCCFKGAD